MSLNLNKSKFVGSKKLMLASIFLLSANADAEVVMEHLVKVKADTEYHSNIQYLERDAESAYVYTLTPQYEINALDGVNQWFGHLGIALQRSSNDDVSGRREDPFAMLGWVRDLENGKFGLTAEYARESTREAQLFDTGLVSADGTSVTRSIVANWTRSLTERLDLKVKAGYLKEDFSGSLALVGYSTREVSTELEYKLNERMTPFLLVGATDYRADGRIQYQTGMVGSSVIFSPQLQIKAGAGVTRFSTFDQNEAVGFLQAKYKKAKSQVSLVLSREAFETGANSTDIGDRFMLGYIYALSEKNRFGSELELGQNKTDQKNQEFLGYFERDFTPSWLMRVSMNLSNLKREGQNSVNNNTIGVSLIYNGLKF